MGVARRKFRNRVEGEFQVIKPDLLDEGVNHHAFHGLASVWSRVLPVVPNGNFKRTPEPVPEFDIDDLALQGFGKRAQALTLGKCGHGMRERLWATGGL